LVRVLRGLKATATARPMLRMFGSQPSHKEEHGKAVDHHDDHSSHHHEINRDKIVLRNPRSGYYLNPKEVATRIVKIIGLYDTVGDVSKVKLTTQWHELGLDEIDMVNISVAVENDFDIEFPDE